MSVNLTEIDPVQWLDGSVGWASGMCRKGEESLLWSFGTVLISFSPSMEGVRKLMLMETLELALPDVKAVKTFKFNHCFCIRKGMWSVRNTL